jgi:hypothetical protein
MKSYKVNILTQDNSWNQYRAFYDRKIGLWTVYQLDSEGNQKGDASYFKNRNRVDIYFDVVLKSKNVIFHED